MIIDAHGHVLAPSGLAQFQAGLFAGRPRKPARQSFTDEQIEAGITKSRWGNHFERLKSVGTDRQFISFRPYTAAMYFEPHAVVRSYIETCNDVIGRQVQLHPELYRGVCAMPQGPGLPAKEWVDELERCVKEMGFIGCIINPDPGERGDNSTPGMGDEYWYPLYEKMVELDVPGLIHSAGCALERLSYTTHFINEETIAVTHLLESNVFKDFPNLKLIVSHGGGAVPYHFARWAAGWHSRWGGKWGEPLKKLYYDTAVYDKAALELLFKVVGTDNVLFGTENPGTGSVKNSDTGEFIENLAPVIKSIDFLTDEDKHKIFEGNARRVFSRYED